MSNKTEKLSYFIKKICLTLVTCDDVTKRFHPPTIMPLKIAAKKLKEMKAKQAE